MLNSNLKVLEADSFKKQETGVGKRYLLIYLFIIINIFFFGRKSAKPENRDFG